MYLKVVRYENGQHQGFSIYEGERVHVGKYEVTVEYGPESVSMEPDPNHTYFIMNDAGDTIDRFPGSWLSGSLDGGVPPEPPSCGSTLSRSPRTV